MAAPSVVVAYELLVMSCEIWSPDQGLNPRPLHWGHSPSLWTTREVPICWILNLAPRLLHYRSSPYFKTEQNPNIQLNLAPYLGIVPLGLSGGEEDKSRNPGKLGGWCPWSGHLLPVPETLETSLNTVWNDSARSVSPCGRVTVFIIAPSFLREHSCCSFSKGILAQGILSPMCLVPECLT